MPRLSDTQRRVIFRSDVVGRVGLKLAAARVEPETGVAVNFFRAVDESPLIYTTVRNSVASVLR
jgi:hypothetical protein